MTIFTPNTVIKSADINTNFDEITSAWESWSPTYSGISIGDGTATAFCKKIGKTVHFVHTIICGSTTAITTFPQFSLPYNRSSNYTATVTIVGTTIFNDGGVFYIGVSGLLTSAQSIALRVMGSAGTYANWVSPTSTVPFVIASGDQIVSTGTYESA
jgi:hypothetical protein